MKTYLCINCYLLIHVADTSSCYRSNFPIRDKTFYFIMHKSMSFYLSHYVVVEIILSKNHKQLRNITLYYHIVTSLNVSKFEICLVMHLWEIDLCFWYLTILQLLNPDLRCTRNPPLPPNPSPTHRPEWHFPNGNLSSHNSNFERTSLIPDYS